MKKVLVVLTILAVLVLGVVGALAVFPHAHGKDFNHSQHETCPIYQFGIHNVHADALSVQVFIVLFLFCFLVRAKNSVTINLPFFHTSSRAPPVLA